MEGSDHVTRERNAKMASGLNSRKAGKNGALCLEDVTCGICLSILVEPVTMPCSHELCMPCFEQQVQKTSLHCPMCRLRIGSWTRKASRENCLVNIKLWEVIQKKFKREVQRRLRGLEESFDKQVPELKLAEPGEIKKEFEDQLKLFKEEQMRRQQREEAESCELIRALQQEDFETCNRRRTLRNPSAKSPSVNFPSRGTRWKRVTVSEVPVHNDNLAPSTSRGGRSPSVESGDSIAQELQHFKPILPAPRTPPKTQTAPVVHTPQFVTATPRTLCFDEENTVNPVVERTLSILESERWIRVTENGPPKKRARGRPKGTRNSGDGGGKENERTRVPKDWLLEDLDYFGLNNKSPYHLRSRAK